MVLLETLKTLVIEGRLMEAPEAAREILQAGGHPQQIIDQSLITAMEIVGERFASGDLFIPEMLLSARTMQACLTVLRPFMVEEGVKPKAVAVFGTVKGDVHDIGKNLVIMMMQGAGFEVHDLGVNVSPDKFHEALAVVKPDLCCMSALLSTTQGAMEETIHFLEKEGIRSHVKTMVGGAAITDSFAVDIGADGYAPDAVSAVERAKELLALK